MPYFSNERKVRVLLEKFVANPSLKGKRAYAEELKAYLGKRNFLSVDHSGALLVATPAPERLPTIIRYMASVILEYDERGKLQVLKNRDDNAREDNPYYTGKHLHDFFPGALRFSETPPTLWQRLMADE